MISGTTRAWELRARSWTLALLPVLLLGACTSTPSETPRAQSQPVPSAAPAATRPPVTHVSEGLSLKYAQGFAEMLLGFYLKGRAGDVEQARIQFTRITSCDVNVYGSTFDQKNWRDAEASSFAKLKEDLATTEGVVIGHAFRARVGVVTAVTCP